MTDETQGAGTASPSAPPPDAPTDAASAGPPVVEEGRRFVDYQGPASRPSEDAYVVHRGGVEVWSLPADTVLDSDPAEPDFVRQYQSGLQPDWGASPEDFARTLDVRMSAQHGDAWTAVRDAIQGAGGDIAVEANAAAEFAAEHVPDALWAHLEAAGGGDSPALLAYLADAQRAYGDVVGDSPPTVGWEGAHADGAQAIARWAAEIPADQLPDADRVVERMRELHPEATADLLDRLGLAWRQDFERAFREGLRAFATYPGLQAMFESAGDEAGFHPDLVWMLAGVARARSNYQPKRGKQMSDTQPAFDPAAASKLQREVLDARDRGDRLLVDELQGRLDRMYANHPESGRPVVGAGLRKI